MISCTHLRLRSRSRARRARSSSLAFRIRSASPSRVLNSSGTSTDGLSLFLPRPERSSFVRDSRALYARGFLHSYVKWPSFRHFCCQLNTDTQKLEVIRRPTWQRVLDVARFPCSCLGRPRLNIVARFWVTMDAARRDRARYCAGPVTSDELGTWTSGTNWRGRRKNGKVTEFAT